MPPLKNACCCCGPSLRTSNIIVGWFQLITGLIATASIIYFITQEAMKERDPEEDKEWKKALPLMIINVVATCLGPVIGAFHLYGSYKRRRGFLIPYLVIGMIQLITLTIGLVQAAITDPKAEFIVTYVIMLGINIYLYVLVTSFYIQLSSKD